MDVETDSIKLQALDNVSPLNMAETWLSIGESVATILAVAVGAYWTYRLYVKQRLSFPHINVEIKDYQNLISRDRRLIHIFLNLRNTGNTLFRAAIIEVELRQVLPINEKVVEEAMEGYDPIPEDETELTWTCLVARQWEYNKKKKFEIEPGEHDTLHADFVIDSGVEAVQVYVFVKNPKKRNIGWTEVKFITCKN